MSDKSFMLYCRKMINNPLLARKQILVELIHPDSAGVTKAAIKEKLSAMYDKKAVEAISIFGYKTKFGGGRSSCFALIYDNADAKKKYDAKVNLNRDFGKPTKNKLGEPIKGR